MPNWCMTNYVFEGSKEEIANLHQKLQSLDESKKSLIENGFGTNWLGNVVSLFGGDWEKIRCRGAFYNLQSDSETTLSFGTETAWSDMDEVWRFICGKYETIRYFYSAEESGNCYYSTNDKEGKYFPERFIVESYEGETSYENTVEDMLRLVSERLGQILTTKEEMEKAVETYNESCGEDEYLYVNEFSVQE